MDLPSSDPVPAKGSAEELRHVLYTQRVGMLFVHTARMCCLSGIFAYVLAYVLHGSVNNAHLGIWLVIKTATLVPRVVQLHMYRHTSAPGSPAWRPGLIALLALDGAAWGLGCAWLMPSDNLTICAIIVASMVGVGSVSSVVLQADLACHMAFSVPFLVPAGLTLLMHRDIFGIFGGAGTLVLMVVMLFEGHRGQQRFTELVTLRHCTMILAEERAAALIQAERDSAYKSRFLAQLSHELRTPLHGILGLSRLVRARQSDPLSREQLQLLERSGKHLLGVINDVLDLSKIEAGHLKIVSQPFDLAKLIDDVVALSAVSASGKGLELRTESKLPRPWVVMGDPARVRQILLNLMGNAVKFTEQGSVCVRVAAQRDHPKRVNIAVKDTGPGMTPADQLCIFEAFKQLDNGRGRIPGTGLGLTISRELARAMNGDVLCNSVLGQGSEFIFTVELEPTDVPVREVSPTASPTETLPRKLHGHVLLAEDNPVNALVAEALLRELGLRVSTVTDGCAAVEFMRAQHPDLILMDCQMPLMDGFEATLAIRRLEQTQGRSTPIVALTANALDSDRERCLEAGMNDHLAKPFELAELQRMLLRHLPQVITPQSLAVHPDGDFSDTASGTVIV